MLQVPDVVAAKAQAHGVDAWIDELPDLVARIAGEWSLTVGEVLDGGTEALVVAVGRRDDSPAVLKLLVPGRGPAALAEIQALQLDAGRGCAALYSADLEIGALLIEHLGPSMHDLGVPIEQRHVALCAAAQRMWHKVPSQRLTTGAQKGRWLVDFIDDRQQRLDRPCSPRVMAEAFECAARRVAAHDDRRAVLVHGDVHEWNALRVEGAAADDAPWKLIDPDGLFAEPEYDLGVMMREDPVELLDGDPRERAARLAEWTGTDAQAIWEWGVVERVACGLLAVEIGLQPVGDQMLAAAEALVGA
ncbi:MAG: aminoglycoside phosphotransferase family protein [Actinomycetota bacterium]